MRFKSFSVFFLSQQAWCLLLDVTIYMFVITSIENKPWWGQMRVSLTFIIIVRIICHPCIRTMVSDDASGSDLCHLTSPRLHSSPQDSVRFIFNYWNEHCQVRGMWLLEPIKSVFLMWGPAAIWHKEELLVYFRDNVVGNKTRVHKLMERWHILQFVDPSTFTFFENDVVYLCAIFVRQRKPCFPLRFSSNK